VTVCGSVEALSVSVPAGLLAQEAQQSGSAINPAANIRKRLIMVFSFLSDGII
jgi:hypothetical protein